MRDFACGFLACAFTVAAYHCLRLARHLQATKDNLVHVNFRRSNHDE